MDFNARRLDMEVEEKEPGGLVSALGHGASGPLRGVRWSEMPVGKGEERGVSDFPPWMLFSHPTVHSPRPGPASRTGGQTRQFRPSSRGPNEGGPHDRHAAVAVV